MLNITQNMIYLFRRVMCLIQTFYVLRDDFLMLNVYLKHLLEKKTIY